MYNNIRKKLNKFYNGGALKSQRDSGDERKIPKYNIGGFIEKGYSPEEAEILAAQYGTYDDYWATKDPGLPTTLNSGVTKLVSPVSAADITSKITRLNTSSEDVLKADARAARKARAKEGFNNFAEGMGFEDATATSSSGKEFSLSAGALMGMTAAVGAVNAIDDLTMGDKNFGALSEAIDNAVHAASGALMKSGNPYAFAAGVALEGANFLTKAGGQTVQGFDVDINSSGYGNMGHMESSSSRDFGALLGLGGFAKGNVKKKLAKRNEQARMALEAADIADELRFEQEARMDSISNVVANNQTALAGGIELGSLGA